uniref:Uncharacterized protein n=1 Tax=Panagrolaimus davidi TaxID=227884 RepID=A0A914PD91_9BILA
MGMAGKHVNKTMRVLSNTAIFGNLGVNGVNIAQKQTLDNLRSEMTDDTQRLNFDREILIDRQTAKGKTGIALKIKIEH